MNNVSGIVNRYDVLSLIISDRMNENISHAEVRAAIFLAGYGATLGWYLKILNCYEEVHSKIVKVDSVELQDYLPPEVLSEDHLYKHLSKPVVAIYYQPEDEGASLGKQLKRVFFLSDGFVVLGYEDNEKTTCSVVGGNLDV